MPSEFGPWSSAMSTGIRVELNTFWKKRLIMLPSLVVSGSEMSFRGNLTFLCCALILLGLPTFYGVAKSQEAEPAVESKAAAENTDPAVKETNGVEPTEKLAEIDPDEVTIPELVAQFNELIKEKRFGEAKLIGRIAKEIDPKNPVGEIMLWKAKFSLSGVKTYSSNSSDETAPGSKASAVTNVRRPRAAILRTVDDAQEEAGRALQWSKAIEKAPKNSAEPVSTSPKTVHGSAELPVPVPPRAKIPVTPEMAQLVEQFNAALTARRYYAAEGIAREAKQLEPEIPTAEIMLWKARVARRATETHPNPEYLPQPKFSMRETEVVKKLDEVIAFDFDGQPLETALRQLEKQLGFNIFLDVVSMEKHKLGRNQSVTIRVREISLKNALKLVLDAHDLTFLLEHERMTILPKLEASSRLETRIYPVRDLVLEKEDFDTLIEAIRGGVAPESWNERASISSVLATGSLVIFQSPGVHSDILQLLRALREAKEVPAGGAGADRKGPDNPTAGIGIGATGGGGGFF